MKAIFRNLCRTLMDREGRGHLGGDWSTNLIEQFDVLPDPTQAAGKSYSWDLSDAGTTAVPTVAFATDGGGIAISTANGNDDCSSLFPLASGPWSVSRLANGTRKHRLSAKIKTGASVAATAFFWGMKLTDTPVLATDDDQIGFFYDSSATTLAGSSSVAAGMTTIYALVSVGGTDYVFNTGITVAASTDYDLALEIGTDKIGRLFLNGTQINMPGVPVLTAAAAFKPVFMISTRTTAVKTHTIRQFHYLGK